MPKIHSIGHRLFLSTALILLTTIAATLLFGSSLIERYYVHNKEVELKHAYQSFSLAFNRNESLPDWKTAGVVLYDAEKRNNNVMLFTIDANGNIDQLIYTSRYNNWSGTNDSQNSFKPAYSPKLWLERAQHEGAFSQDISKEPLVITSNGSDNRPQIIDLYSQLSDDCYLFLSTPKEQISLAANLATKYYVIITCLTFFLLTIAIYFQSKRFTKPIIEINSAAQRISQMDFATPCNVTTGDELQNLSQSINVMAQNLKAYIAEMELNQELLQKDLERETKTNQMRREFIANVSHDFKTPLTLIRAYTEAMLEQHESDAELKESCEIILKEDDRMTSLVTQLLQLSKLEGGVGQLEMTLFPIDEAIHEILHNSKILQQAKNITVALETNGSEDHLVYGDYAKIQQVLHNLIENALKYSPKNDIITITSVNIAPSKYRFSIVNTTSHPLSDEELADIFISFHRLDKARTADGKNFGLGLAIVKAVMELHHQAFGAYNKDDTHICFYFELDADTEESDSDQD